MFRTNAIAIPPRAEMPSGTRHRAGWVAAGPAALTLVLGLWGITRENSMWRDEAATWEAAHRTIPETVHMLDRIDVVHGLYYLFMHGVFALAGDSLVTLRLPSVLAMAGAAAMVTLLGSRLAGRCTGLACGLAFALIPAFQQYAQEGRPYALVTACTSLACLLLVAAVESPGAGRWTAYGVTVLVAALLNWFSLLMLCAHAATIVLGRPPRGTVVRWGIASSCAVIGTLPLVVASGTQSQQVAWIRPVSPSTLSGLLLTLAAGALCARAIRPGERLRTPIRPGERLRTPRGTRLPLTAVALPLLVLPPLVLLAASLAHPVYLTRYVLFHHIGLALLIGGACHALALRLHASSHRTIVGVMALAFAGLLPVQLSLRSANSRVDDVLATAESVAAVRETGDAVLYIPAARRDTALVSPTAFTGTRDLALVRSPAESGTLSGVERGPEQIAAAMRAVPRIVVVSDAGAPPATTDRDRAKQRVLKAYFVRCSATTARGRQVTVYLRRHDRGGCGPAGRSPEPPHAGQRP
ncbi:glycosyltransferase family 39 protein [Streptomyces sp. NBC_01022]|uniref:glycosyltransferase family 39 protein n=1 Tax=Streptomyces sp. NBC_01022 TaxID=2903723 RepID=UPI002DD9E8C1|nr:glycosyltransferase family 39 protein [Streptomyces sp. NBC_01022]WRZ82373.1 glycosyltransferase family 39 protein [Streptomyces sp. NBC_01022]